MKIQITYIGLDFKLCEIEVKVKKSKDNKLIKRAKYKMKEYGIPYNRIVRVSRKRSYTIHCYIL